MAFTQYSVTCATPGGSSNSKGSYVEVVASTPYNSSRMFVILGTSTTHGAAYMLLDIATGAAGSEVVKVSNLLFMIDPSWITTTPVEIDIDIPSGTRIAIRTQSSGIAVSHDFAFYLEDRAIASIANPVTYGSDTSTSKGTAVDPGGTANTKGAYTQITASTSQRIDALLLSVVRNNGVTATATEWLIDVATGASGSETVVVPNIKGNWDKWANGFIRPIITRFPVSIASGSRLAVRCQSTSASAFSNVISVSIVGMQLPSSGAGGGGASSVAYIG